MTETNQSSEARHTILSSIREHLAASKRFDVRGLHSLTVGERQGLESPEGDRQRPVIEVFRQALEAVSGNFITAHSLQEVAHEIQRIIDEKQAHRIAVSNNRRVREIIAQLKTDATFLEGPAQAELFDCDLGITGAQWAIAETGTLVIESERERNRFASLVPPVHIAIIEGSRIRQTMSEVLELIRNSEVGLSRAVTFITGPSRTSDIELTLAIGVHGPGELHVIAIDDL